MAKNKTKKICVVCEGYEDYDYFQKLKKCGVFDSVYSINCKNAKTITNVAAVYQSAFQNDSNDIVIVFCDTEMAPYEQFCDVKNKINQFHNKQNIADDVVFFANPCTMQIILSHFGMVQLTTNSKTNNAALIKGLTGVSNYQAKEKQRQAIMRKITAQNYTTMKTNLSGISTNCATVPSTNFLTLINNLEQPNTAWVGVIAKKY